MPVTSSTNGSRDALGPARASLRWADTCENSETIQGGGRVGVVVELTKCQAPGEDTWSTETHGICLDAADDGAL